MVEEPSLALLSQRKHAANPRIAYVHIATSRGANPSSKRRAIEPDKTSFIVLPVTKLLALDKKSGHQCKTDQSSILRISNDRLLRRFLHRRLMRLVRCVEGAFQARIHAPFCFGVRIVVVIGHWGF